MSSRDSLHSVLRMACQAKTAAITVITQTRMAQSKSIKEKSARTHSTAVDTYWILDNITCTSHDRETTNRPREEKDRYGMINPYRPCKRNRCHHQDTKHEATGMAALAKSQEKGTSSLVATGRVEKT